MVVLNFEILNMDYVRLGRSDPNPTAAYP